VTLQLDVEPEGPLESAGDALGMVERRVEGQGGAAVIRRRKRAPEPAPAPPRVEADAGGGLKRLARPRNIGRVAQAGGMAEQQPRIELGRLDAALAQGASRLDESLVQGQGLSHAPPPAWTRAGWSDAR